MAIIKEDNGLISGGGSDAVTEKQSVTNSGQTRTITTTNDFSQYDNVAMYVTSNWGPVCVAITEITSNSISYILASNTGYASNSYPQDITIIGSN